MKKIFFYCAIITLLAVSCTKPELKESKSNARIMQQMTNGEMEEAILLFLDKLEDQAYYEDTIKADEALEYIEASLNYLYGDIDYTYFGNIVEVESDMTVTFAKHGHFTIEEVKNIYDALKEDWSTEFNEIQDNDKKPAVFDVIGLDGTKLFYRMIFTHGIIDLEEYELPYEMSGTIHWVNAGDAMSNIMSNYLNNEMAILNWCPNHRQYLVFVNSASLGSKGPLNANDPNPGDGYIDNWFWYTNKSEPGYHLYLDNSQFQFHLSKYFQAVSDYMSQNHPTKHVGLSWIAKEYRGGTAPYFLNPDVAWHDPMIVFANLYCTQTNVSQL